MSVDLYKLNFFSGVNYMKRDAVSGSTTINMNATYTVNHNLGYIPFYQVLYDADNNDKIWSPQKYNIFLDTGIGGALLPPYILSTINTTTLSLTLTDNGNPANTGSRKVYWIIYKDYGNI